MDPVMAEVIKRLPPLPAAWRKGHSVFGALAVEVIAQQLSSKAATTIVKRFKALFPGKRFPTPDDVLAIPTEKVRAAGLSYAKVKYIKEIASSIKNGQLRTRRLRYMEDEAIIAELTKIKGIGKWTAEMFLMFVLERPDVFSHGDLGLRNAIQKLYGFKKPPTVKQVEKIVSKWRPYRTIASRYLWRSLDEI
jgi:DNA-3-methyladenine glycosylase II